MKRLKVVQVRLLAFLLLLSVGQGAMATDDVEGQEAERAVPVDVAKDVESALLEAQKLAETGLLPMTLPSKDGELSPDEKLLRRYERQYRWLNAGGWIALGLCVLYNGTLLFATAVGRGIGDNQGTTYWQDVGDVYGHVGFMLPTIGTLAASATCFILSRVSKNKWRKLKVGLQATQLPAPSDSGTLRQVPALGLCLTF